MRAPQRKALLLSLCLLTLLHRAVCLTLPLGSRRLPLAPPIQPAFSRACAISSHLFL